MRDDAADAQKARVMALHDAWAGPLGLTYQRITYRWYRGAIPNYPEATMTVDPDWQYSRVLVSVDLTEVKKADDAELTFAFVHELMHVFLAGLVQAHTEKVDREAFRMLEEHTASQLAKGIIWVRDAAEGKAIPSGPADEPDQQEDGPEPPEDPS